MISNDTDTYAIEILFDGVVIKKMGGLDKRQAKALFYANYQYDRYPRVIHNGQPLTLRKAEKHFGRPAPTPLPD